MLLFHRCEIFFFNIYVLQNNVCLCDHIFVIETVFCDILRIICHNVLKFNKYQFSQAKAATNKTLEPEYCRFK